jgi:ATP-dependent DNA ligase
MKMMGAVQPEFGKAVWRTRNEGLSVRQPARSKERTLGRGVHSGGDGDCRWLEPALVGQFEFTEWTPENHLRHSRFVAIREDKVATGVIRETGIF